MRVSKKNPIKAYKGFNADMTCRDFKYEEDKEYEEENAVLCESGFHACEYPLDVFEYYEPANHEFHEVELFGNVDKQKNKNKIASTHIKIGAKLDIAGIVKAAIDFTMSKTNPEVKSDEGCGASSATGNYGASSATGYCGASSATGDCGASSSTGYKSASESGNPTAIAVAWGYHSMAKGVLGSYLVLSDWVGDENDINNPDAWTLKGAKMIKIDGKKYMPDTFYKLEKEKVVEVNENSES